MRRHHWKLSALQKERLRINNINDVLKVGQVVRIKVIEADDKGRLRLSIKAIGGIEAQGGPQGPAAANPEPSAE